MGYEAPDVLGDPLKLVEHPHDQHLITPEPVFGRDQRHHPEE